MYALKCYKRISGLRALHKLGSTESIILLGDFNAHIRTDSETWKDVIGRHGDPEFNKNGRYLLQLCSSNGLCIMNTFFNAKMSTSTHGTDLVWHKSL